MATKNQKDKGPTLTSKKSAVLKTQSTEELLASLKTKFLQSDRQFMDLLQVKLENIKQSLETEFYYFSKRIVNIFEYLNLLKFQKRTGHPLNFLFETSNRKLTAAETFAIEKLKETEVKSQENIQLIDNCIFQLLNSEHKILLNYNYVCPTGYTLIQKYGQIVDKYIKIDPPSKKIQKQQHHKTETIVLPEEGTHTASFNQPSLKNFSMQEYAQIYDVLQSAGKKLSKAQMIYRASDNGFRSKKFKQFCSKMSKTLTIVRSSNGKIFGGYTPCKWLDTKEKQYMPDLKGESFLFSLDNHMVFPIRQNQHDYAISTYGNWGPIFGSPYGPDLSISDQCNLNEHSCSSLGSHYEIPSSIKQFSNEAFSLLAGSKKFKVIEYQVYDVEFEGQDLK